MAYIAVYYVVKSLNTFNVKNNAKILVCKKILDDYMVQLDHDKSHHYCTERTTDKPY